MTTPIVHTGDYLHLLKELNYMKLTGASVLNFNNEQQFDYCYEFVDYQLYIAEVNFSNDGCSLLDLPNISSIIIETPEDQDFKDKIIVNWTGQGERNQQWNIWKEQGLDKKSIFVGDPRDYVRFLKHTHWRIEFWPTDNLFDLATAINNGQEFIGTVGLESMLAQALGKTLTIEGKDF